MIVLRFNGAIGVVALVPKILRGAKKEKKAVIINKK